MQGVCTGDIVVSQFDPVPNRFFFFLLGYNSRICMLLLCVMLSAGMDQQ